MSERKTMQSEVIKLLTLARRMPTGCDVEPDAVNFYSAVFHEAGLDPSEIGPAFARYATENRFAPMPADIVKEARTIRKQRERDAHYDRMRAEVLAASTPLKALSGPELEAIEDDREERRKASAEMQAWLAERRGTMARRMPDE